ncbi:MAG: hypothetical protein R3C53_11545 [Pirellulaceae bacterium]
MLVSPDSIFLSPDRFQTLENTVRKNSLFFFLFFLCGCADSAHIDSARSSAGLGNELQALKDERVTTTAHTAEPIVPEAIRLFCSDCHALPRPESFSREVWYDEIEKGYEFYARSGRNDLVPPPLQDVLQFYREHAPVEIVFPEPLPVDQQWRARFEIERVDWSVSPQLSPAISSLTWADLSPQLSFADQPFQLIATDMRDGTIHALNLVRGEFGRSTTAKLLARSNNPARATVGDLDRNGCNDLLISDLGSFRPYDHQLGSVEWLKRSADSDNFELVTVIESLGRVADVVLGDFNDDDFPDLLVAEFGHRDAGGIHLFENLADTASPGLQFNRRQIDGRPGTIRIPVHDWDANGQLDFAAIVSQEFEAVDLFLNRSHKFDRIRVATGEDLTFGSVGLEPTDLDADGDVDLLVVNGDTFDNNFANRSHGIAWLENRGNLRFAHHRIIELPGAYCAVADDLDGDADLDIVVVANLPTKVYPESLNLQQPVSVMLLEQVAPREFEPRVLERGTPRYPALEIADFNGDGKKDFAVGTQLFDTDPPDSAASRLPRVAIWWQK